MTAPYKPLIPKHLLETILWFAILAGLVDLVHKFHTLGYLPAPFVFDVSDTFMDWYNVAYWGHNPGGYSVWNSVYAPLSFVITNIFGLPSCYHNAPKDARDCDLVGVVQILWIYGVCAFVTALAFYRRNRSTAIMRTTAIAVGGPMLFALERGNLIMHAYVAFVLVYGQLLTDRKWVAFAAGFAVNMKSYLLFPIITFGLKREWRFLELCGVATITIYVLSLVVLGSGTLTEIAHNLTVWFSARASSIWDEVIYSTTYKPYLLFDERQYPVRDFVEQRIVDVAKHVIYLEVLATRLVCFLCLFVGWVFPRLVSARRLAFFMLMQSFMNQNPGGYAVMFVTFLVFMEDWTNGRIGLAIVMAYLINIPTDYYVTVFYEIERASWLSGRLVNSVYGLSIGALIRPGAIVIMVWCMAIDTLCDVHRAMGVERPRFNLGSDRRRLAADVPV